MCEQVSKNIKYHKKCCAKYLIKSLWRNDNTERTTLTIKSQKHKQLMPLFDLNSLTVINYGRQVSNHKPNNTDCSAFAYEIKFAISQIIDKILLTIIEASL